MKYPSIKFISKRTFKIFRDVKTISEEVIVLKIKRGEIYYADLSPVVGSEQGGLRPVLIIQNDTGNMYSPTVIAAAITSRQSKTSLPTHILVHSETSGLPQDSTVLLEQVRTLDKARLKGKTGQISAADMYRINKALSVSLGLQPETIKIG